MAKQAIEMDKLVAISPVNHVSHRTIKILFQRYSNGDINDAMAKTQQEILEDSCSSRLVRNIGMIESEHVCYTPFYHAIRPETYVCTLFIKALFSLVLKPDDLCTLAFLRLPDPHSPKTAHEFFEAFSHLLNKSCFDKEPSVIRELLSVIPCLFSNAHHGSESTWSYYSRNHNATLIDPSQFFNTLCDHFLLLPDPAKRKKYIHRLIAFHTDLLDYAKAYLGQFPSDHYRNSRKGVILQILIPDELVSHICYRSSAFGRPAKKQSNTFSFTQLMFELSRQEEENTTIVDEDDIIEDGRAQGRLLVQNLMVKNYGIKTFVHGYGRFFNPALQAHHAPFPESFNQAQMLANSTVAIEDNPLCKELLQKKEDIFMQIQNLFREIIFSSPTTNPDAAFVDTEYKRPSKS